MKKIIVLLSMIISLILMISAWKEPETKFLGLFTMSQDEFQENVKMLEEGELGSQVYFEHTKLFYNSNKEEFFITVGEEIKGNFLADGHMKLFWLEENIVDTYMQKVKDNEGFLIGIINDSQYDVITLKITTLPLIQIEAEELALEKMDILPYKDGTVRIVDADDEETGRYAEKNFTMHYKVRGEITSEFVKKPYKLELLDKNGVGEKHSLLGMREDDDWNLIAAYTDDSKIREAVTLDLFEDIMDQAEHHHAHPQDFAFCELFINDSYEGIYQVIEPMDTKQMKVNKKTDYIYKADGWYIYPTEEEFRAANNTEEEENLFITTEHFPEGTEETKYDPIIDFMKTVPFDIVKSPEGLQLDAVEDVMDMENLLDLSIFKVVLDLTDNDMKNMYYVMREQEDGTFLVNKEYFDFNYGFGDIYMSNETGTGHKSIYVPRVDYVTDSLLYGEDAEEYIEIFTDRYWELRETALSKENIIATIDKQYGKLIASGVYGREYERWGLTEKNSQDEYYRMLEFVELQLPCVDEFVNNLYWTYDSERYHQNEE